jgi:uncharacterized membrane protein YfcA
MKISYFVLTIVFICIVTFHISAQDSIPLESGNFFNPPPKEKVDENTKLLMTDLEFKLTVAVLVFGFLIITMEMILTKLNKIDSQDSIKFIIITLIITGTLFLITAGYSNNQIAPAMGLLGTIAGYLLGKQNQNQNHEK